MLSILNRYDYNAKLDYLILLLFIIYKDVDTLILIIILMIISIYVVTGKVYTY